MKLFSLLKDIKCRVFGNLNLNISGLFHKDTEVKENGLFFCVRGIRVDGNSFIQGAINNGAVAIVTDQEVSGVNVTQIIVKNVRETMSLISCKFYGNPADKIKIIGVTGTNGKTTITTIISNILNNLGKKCALIGTNGVFINGEKFETGMTTPDPIELQKYLSLIVKKKIEYVAMEVSAHAIDLNKIAGITFSQMIFTNLTEDHLDYFKTMEKYFETKSKVFSNKYTKLSIINIDDGFGEIIASSIKTQCFTYSTINNKSDLFASDIKQTINGQTFKCFSNNYFLPILGIFNLYNSLAVILSLKNLGISENQIALELKNIEPISGRFNFYNVCDKKVIIDYAHTPDGLANILNACKEIANDNKVICVFGCGGDRDKNKRPIMGEIASMLSDFTFITSDNPRFEDKQKIINDIEKGMTNDKYKIVIDRKKAIIEALDYAKAGDLVVIAGKGAENYIEENGIIIPYSDKSEIEKYRR
ncbi:MAG: UDP-N-acetylmuramoyl-L-alanyl-D-glutamate--2,6-diaminopimelate ligase [Clostridia bacterium]|nr:UDP-N-acetylmuramoyl-L-alanyl-D-glutamate--2,6-diaminopimelate ligase [Clostridia bacterium]